ncbi:hypothetical protein DV738_g3257, partial [Chaetothyriales sp. CBS 135597]
MAAATSSTAPLPAIYSLSPPRGQITADDHGGYTVVCGWIMMCFFVISVLTRLLTKTVPVVTLGLDDIMSGLSMVFGIGQTVAIHIAATNGLGRHQNFLSAKSFRTYTISYYTANLLYFLAVGFAKISIVMIIMRLSPSHLVRQLCLGTLVLISSWALGEILAFAFQSPTPYPWNYRQRPGGANVPALYYTAAVGDMISDLIVILLPAYVIWQVQISARKRLVIIAVFATRISVVICSLIRIPPLTRYVNSSDRSWHAVAPQTWLQVIQCLSITTACLPCLKPFLAALESGFMDLSLRKTRSDGYHPNSNGFGAGNLPVNVGSKGSGASYAVGTKKKSRPNSAGLAKQVESYPMDSLDSPDSDNGAPGPAIEEDASPKPLHYLHDHHHPLTSHPERSPSVTESQRILTSRSTDGDEGGKHSWEVSLAEAKNKRKKLAGKLSNDTIKVTKEVEVRSELVPPLPLAINMTEGGERTQTHQHTRQATLADVPQMARVFADGFLDDDVYGRFMHPKRREYPQDWLRSWEDGMRAQLANPRAVTYVSTERGVVKACIVMHWLGADVPDNGADPEAIAAFERNWDDIKQHFTGARAESWFIERLCVAPDAQKRGHGRALVQEAIARCRREGEGKEGERPTMVPLAVIASEVGDAFYDKLGFREVGRANVGALSGVKGGSLKFYQPGAPLA